MSIHLPILDGWSDLEVPVASSPVPFPIRKSARHLSQAPRVPRTAEEAEALVTDLSRLRLGAIAIDTEFRFAAPEQTLPNGQTWQDLSSLTPLILSGAAWMPEENTVIRFAFDLRQGDLIPSVDRLLRLHVPIIAHYVAAELHTLWALGLDPVLHQVWCTYTAARAMSLGHRPQKRDTAADVDGQATYAASLSLNGLAKRYGVAYPFASQKQDLQKSFLSHAPDQPFSNDQMDYALADAEATLGIYLQQQNDVLAAGLLSHLNSVEFPFAIANARMTWKGVKICPDRARNLRQALIATAENIKNKLQKNGLENPASQKQVLQFLTNRGLGPKLSHRGKASTEDRVLEGLVDLDPTVALIRHYRRFARMAKDPLLVGTLCGRDGRVHPRHQHLGAETGRNTCSTPNIVGLPGKFRPLVVAPTERVIFEVDYAQIEVGITAAEYGDTNLIQAFNSGDVYAAVAQHLFADRLDDATRMLTPTEFKVRHGDLRERAKVFVLATIYGMNEQSVADRFGMSLSAARTEQIRFFEAFPALGQVARNVGHEGTIRSFAPILGGLRRWVPENNKARNRHMNTPIQAGAGVIFRRAVVALDRAFHGTGTHLILPVHDAVVVETDEVDLEWAVLTTRTMMEAAVRGAYPCLIPRVEIDRSNPECWCKDGRSASLDEFVAEARRDWSAETSGS